MSWTNFHTHNHYCDGEGRMEEYVIQALSCKMPALGFSSHAPVDFRSTWHMQRENLNHYLADLHLLQKKYQAALRIYSGLEVDYISGVVGPEYFRDLNLDIIIGSIHYVGQLENGAYCSIEETQAGFEQGLQQIFNNNIQKMVSTYYANLISMVEHDPPDIIGHLDIIKKLNHQNKYFDETSYWYQDLVTGVIKVISNSNCIVEVNTRGYYKGMTQESYPSKWILELCLENQIPVTLSSDAHRPDELDQGLAMAAELLLKIGYRQIHVFNGNKWVGTDLSPTGIDHKRVLEAC